MNLMSTQIKQGNDKAICSYYCHFSQPLYQKSLFPDLVTTCKIILFSPFLQPPPQCWHWSFLIFTTCRYLLPRYLSSSSPSTQMVCNSDTWIFSNHYFYQGISPSGVLVGYYSIKELTRQASSASKSFFTSLILYFLAYLVPLSEK